jgi:hypothetical protein
LLASPGASAPGSDYQVWQGVKPKPRQLANGQRIAAERYTIGPLAHMLKNRFYVGEVAYRGEVHKGEHPPISIGKFSTVSRPCLRSGWSPGV